MICNEHFIIALISNHGHRLLYGAPEMAYSPDEFLGDSTCPHGQGHHAFGSLYGAGATCTSRKPMTVTETPDRGSVKRQFLTSEGNSSP